MIQCHSVRKRGGIDSKEQQVLSVRCYSKVSVERRETDMRADSGAARRRRGCIVAAIAEEDPRASFAAGE